MKYLLLLLLTTNAYAGFFIAGSKVNSSEKWNYPTKELCEKKEGETCYEMPTGYNLFYYKLINGKILEDIEMKANHFATLKAQEDAKEQEIVNVLSSNPDKKNAIIMKIIKDYMEKNKIKPEDL